MARLSRTTGPRATLVQHTKANRMHLREQSNVSPGKLPVRRLTPNNLSCNLCSQDKVSEGRRVNADLVGEGQVVTGRGDHHGAWAAPESQFTQPGVVVGQRLVVLAHVQVVQRSHYLCRLLPRWRSQRLDATRLFFKPMNPSHLQ